MSKVIERLTENENLIEEIANTSNDYNQNLRTAITRFVCYFNLFESFLEEQNIDHWYDFSGKIEIKEEKINNYFNFFYERYVDGEKNHINEKFTFKNEYTSKIKNNLLNKENKFYTVLCISYYFRNNLYHGHKDLNSLKDYVDCFNQISRFLLTILENAKEKDNG